MTVLMEPPAAQNVTNAFSNDRRVAGNGVYLVSVLHIVPDHIDDPATTFCRKAGMRRVERRDGRGPRQRQAERFSHQRHGRGAFHHRGRAGRAREALLDGFRGLMRLPLHRMP